MPIINNLFLWQRAKLTRRCQIPRDTYATAGRREPTEGSSDAQIGPGYVACPAGVAVFDRYKNGRVGGRRAQKRPDQRTITISTITISHIPRRVHPYTANARKTVLLLMLLAALLTTAVVQLTRGSQGLMDSSKTIERGCKRVQCTYLLAKRSSFE